MDYSSFIRDIPDFPKKGIIFKDITTLLKDPKAMKRSIDDLANEYRDKKIDKVAGAESRGFIFGAAVAYLLDAGFVPIRKPGKLPADTLSKSYSLEYGTATIEIHKDAISKGEKVLIVDDLLATGGTTKAMIDLIRMLGGEIVGCAFLIELEFLNGRNGIDVPIFSLVRY
jgi:adenine phosphoribosyltransferase